MTKTTPLELLIFPKKEPPQKGGSVKLTLLIITYRLAAARENKTRICAGWVAAQQVHAPFVRSRNQPEGGHGREVCNPLPEMTRLP